MTTIILQIKSNNDKSLQKFLSYLKIRVTKFFFCDQKHYHIIRSKVLFSVLKSAHVNKIAQEQFQINRYNTQVKLITFEDKKLIEFIKNSNNFLFPEIQLRYILFNMLTELKSIKNFLKINNFQDCGFKIEKQIKFNYICNNPNYYRKKIIAPIKFEAWGIVNKTITKINNKFQDILFLMLLIATYTIIRCQIINLLTYLENNDKYKVTTVIFSNLKKLTAEKITFSLCYICSNLDMVCIHTINSLNEKCHKVYLQRELFNVNLNTLKSTIFFSTNKLPSINSLKVINKNYPFCSTQTFKHKNVLNLLDCYGKVDLT